MMSVDNTFSSIFASRSNPKTIHLKCSCYHPFSKAIRYSCVLVQYVFSAINGLLQQVLVGSRQCTLLYCTEMHKKNNGDFHIESSRFPSLYFLPEALTGTMIVIHHEQTAAIDASCARGQKSVKKGLGRLQERVFSQ